MYCMQAQASEFIVRYYYTNTDIDFVVYFHGDMTFLQVSGCSTKDEEWICKQM